MTQLLDALPIVETVNSLEILPEFTNGFSIGSRPSDAYEADAGDIISRLVNLGPQCSYEADDEDISRLVRIESNRAPVNAFGGGERFSGASIISEEIVE